MFNLGMPELILILVIALIVFGPNKLPELAKALGKAVQEFRQAAATETVHTIKSEKTTIDEHKS